MTLDVVYLAWNRLDYTRATFECLIENTNWDLASRLVVYDDGSTDGTREYLDDALQDCPVAHSIVHLGFGSPVATMNHHVQATDADAFAKIDSDVAVPSGWLDALVQVMDAESGLEILGMEAGQTRLPYRDGASWDGAYGYRSCSHVGGVGLMRVEAFRSRQPPRPKGRFGFTEWQHREDPARGWIEPDLLVPQLDRIPAEPWRSLAEGYVERGWQRPWAPMDETWSSEYYAWFLARVRSPLEPRTDAEWQTAADAAHLFLLLDGARQYGLVVGGPAVDPDRCTEILERASDRGIEPRG